MMADADSLRVQGSFHAAFRTLRSAFWPLMRSQGVVLAPLALGISLVFVTPAMRALIAFDERYPSWSVPAVPFVLLILLASPIGTTVLGGKATGLVSALRYLGPRAGNVLPGLLVFPLSIVAAGGLFSLMGSLGEEVVGFVGMTAYVAFLVLFAPLWCVLVLEEPMRFDRALLRSVRLTRGHLLGIAGRYLALFGLLTLVVGPLMMTWTALVWSETENLAIELLLAAITFASVIGLMTLLTCLDHAMYRRQAEGDREGPAVQVTPDMQTG